MTSFRAVGLIAALVAALMAFASPVRATTITSPEGTAYTGAIKAESEGHATLDNPIAEIECNMSFAGTVSSHGSGATARVLLSSLATTGCTNSWHFTTVSGGELEVHWTSGANGTVTWTGMTTESTRFGITCRYSTNSTDIGTVTGGSSPTLDLKAAIPFHSGSGLCGSGTTTFTAGLLISTPAFLLVDA